MHSLSARTALHSLACIRPCRQLEVLDVSECDALTCLLPLAPLTRLRELCIDGCDGITSLRPLRALASLRTLRARSVGCRYDAERNVDMIPGFELCGHSYDVLLPEVGGGAPHNSNRNISFPAEKTTLMTTPMTRSDDVPPGAGTHTAHRPGPELHRGCTPQRHRSPGVPGAPDDGDVQRADRPGRAVQVGLMDVTACLSVCASWTL
jgi:hypothetical protein